MMMTPVELDAKIKDLTKKLEERGNELLRADPDAQNLFGQRTAYTSMKESLNGHAPEAGKKTSEVEKVPASSN